MSVYELSGCGFESRCSHLNFRFCACFEQRVPWHSGNYREWTHSERVRDMIRTYRYNNYFLHSKQPLSMLSIQVYNWKLFFKGHDYALLRSCPKIPCWKRYSQKNSGYVTVYTSLPKIMIICYIVPEIWCVTDVIVIFHFGLFFALLKKWRKTWRCHHFTQVYQEL